MFKIKHIKNKEINNSFLELKNDSLGSYAKIFLGLGASLQELVLNNKTIIKNLAPKSYSNSYASSILFPFTGRIPDGNYTFLNNEYHFVVNDTEKQSALHGLIYNKPFKLIEQGTYENNAVIKLQFTELNPEKGFPYKYTIELLYTLTKSTLSLNVSVKNKDQNPFPYALGWHPYFYSTDLYNSYLAFSSCEKIVLNQDLIPVGRSKIASTTRQQIKNVEFDDCFVLYKDVIYFKTPDYNLSLSATSKENYLQVYTPKQRNSIAIEPMTAPANCFNNDMGVKVLQPNEAYKITWDIKLAIDSPINLTNNKSLKYTNQKK